MAHESVQLDANLEQQPAKHWKQPFQDMVWVSGIIILGISLLLYNFTPEAFRQANNGMAEFFGLNYVFVFAYMVILLTQKHLRWFGAPRNMRFDTFFVYLSIWLVSCFALNRNMTVFQPSAPWLTVHLVLSCGVAIAYAWRDIMAPWVRNVWLAAMAWSGVLFLYFSIYLSNLYPISIPALLFFGLSFHSFVPLIFCIAIARVLYLEMKKDHEVATNGCKWAILVGAMAPILLVGAFLVAWQQRTSRLEATYLEKQLESDSQVLPHWVAMAQMLPKDWVTERVLKSDAYYQVKDEFFSFTPDMGNGVTRVHDPLVMLASTLMPTRGVSWANREKMLRCLYDGRHELQEKLWTGRDLHTQSMHTTVFLDAPQRVSYSEKILTIRNEDRSRFRSQQEALYTFYLPEGGVVTSLSLWIAEKEEKAILAGKSRADSAYTTIVGRERRDPSIVHWQEGNCVTVRVFPCTSEEDRMFKIGVTAPLKDDGQSLIYQNISLQGPPVRCMENIKVITAEHTDFEDNLTQYVLDHEGNHKATKKYFQNWTFTLKKTAFKPSAFTFGGKTYRSAALETSLEHFAPEAIYLDLNSAWTLHQVEEILVAAKGTPVRYALNSAKFGEVTAPKAKMILESARQNKFSLFPFHALAQPDKALVISKYAGSTPTVKELSESPFGKKMKDKLSTSAPVKVWILGEEKDMYLRTLSELRCLQTHNSTLAEVTRRVTEQKYPALQESDKQVVIPGANIMVSEESTAAGAALPKSNDNFMRLYAYNQIMRSISGHYLTKTYEPEPLVEQASEANVVSPVSSLIVLESQADYDRFGIKRNPDALGNASMQSSGAVPEPHEWALILTMLLALFFAHRKIRT